ncbi:MAG TPA: hypothetical protein VL563_05950 [Gemmatimonadales bacterium]|jgi:hypothetical protein|nr:hypothetical protein [Gemmatimonadales bacterium]
MTRPSPFYGLCLTIGALVFGVAGLFHPILTGDGPMQLATIARTPGWRVIHWTLLLSLPLMLAGLAGISLRHQETPGAGPARAGVLIAGFGFAAWMLNILFMAGAGWHLAATYTTAAPGLAATHAVFLYDMIHPMGLAAERLATFTTGLALYLLAWGIWNGRVYWRGFAWGAFVIGAACMVIGVAVDEASVVIYYGQAGVVVWMAAMGVALLVDGRGR